MPPSILNSRKASSISLLVNFSPQVISEWRNISASIWPLISNASNDLIITWSSSVPPDIFSAKRVTIWVKLMGPGASPTMLFASESLMGRPMPSNAFLRSGAVMMPSLSLSMMPKASLNSWICFWLNREKMFEEAFGIIDNDKDGIITAPDLKKAFEGIGRPISDGGG